MLFAIDIGNSNVVIGIFDNGNWNHIWRIPTTTKNNALVFYEYQLQNLLLENGIRPGQFDRAILSSVVPELTPDILTLFNRFLAREAILVHPKIYPDLSITLNRPNEIGTDLLANAVAAKELYQTDAIIVDFGTALTFTTVKHVGEIVAVSIAPGLKTAISSLFQKTAQLPEVPLELPKSILGKNTTQAIQSGVLMGYIGLVRYMIAEIRNEVGSHFKVIGTGGLSSVLHPLRADFDVINPNLTLEGLRIIYQKIVDPL